MPELPDITVYQEALERHCVGHRLEGLRLPGFFLVRTYEVSPFEAQGKTLRHVSRLGKQLVFEWDDDLYFVLHLMIAGRLRWHKAGTKIPGRIGHMALDFDHGTLILTEAGSKKRAAMYVVRGADALKTYDRGGLEPLAATLGEFETALARENRTLKRALTSPHLFSGIGNAYSDEILHRARLSPLKWTSRLTGDQAERLYHATYDVLTEWTERLRREAGNGFPDKVTAFRPEMVVHGKYGQPCLVCGDPVQRIVRAENEVNYCATCQTGGKVLADRSLSTLLKGDWPKTIEEWEALPGKSNA